MTTPRAVPGLEPAPIFRVTFLGYHGNNRAATKTHARIREQTRAHKYNLISSGPPTGRGVCYRERRGRERRKKAQRMLHQVRCVRYDAEEHNRWESWPGSPTEALEGANKDSYADITPFIRDLTDCREFTLDQKKKTNKRNRSL